MWLAGEGQSDGAVNMFEGLSSFKKESAGERSFSRVVEELGSASDHEKASARMPTEARMITKYVLIRSQINRFFFSNNYIIATLEAMESVLYLLVIRCYSVEIVLC